MIKNATQIRAGDTVTLIDQKTHRPVAKVIRSVSYINGNIELAYNSGSQIVTPNSTVEVAEPHGA